ncbi:MAG: alpha/beta fold hydrolase [Cyclobacteriaceae bacterium]|nr:alpha/beta fold hydrolase [Cyclobacteriaceae bacterium]
MKLYYRRSGHGHPLIILHGLFGSSDNWHTLAKTFSQHYTVYLPDQRNHGQSPHSEDMNYEVLAEDLHEFIQEHHIGTPHIIGHSMGGKAAMNFAVRYPAALDKLIVVDIVPKAYPVHHDAILDGLHAIPLENLRSRSEADSLLTPFVPEADVRQFLLKNLGRDAEGRFQWKINLHAIDNNIEAMGAGMIFSGKHDGPALFIRGEKSNYYAPGDEDRIKAIFPNAEVVILDTGHWVQAEKPDEFARVVLSYLTR